MKILHTADWHLGKSLNNYSLLEEQKKALFDIEKIATANDVDVILICGDIFDRSIPSYEAMQVFEEFIDKMVVYNKKKIIAIAGNHDGERLSFGSKLLAKSGLYILNEITDLIIDGIRFVNIPYHNIYQFRKKYGIDFSSTEEAYRHIMSLFKLDDATYNVLLLHDYITHNMEALIAHDSDIKSIQGGQEFVEADLFKEYNYVAIGHMHQAQRVGKDYIRYSGSIYKYSFSEVNHQKSVSLIDTDNGISQIPLLPERDLGVIEGLLEELLQPSYYNLINRNNYIKAIIKDEDEVIDAFSRLKVIYPNLMEIYREKIKGKYNTLDSKMLAKSNNELFKSFYYEMTQNNLSFENEEIVKRYLKEKE